MNRQVELEKVVKAIEPVLNRWAENNGVLLREGEKFVVSVQIQGPVDHLTLSPLEFFSAERLAAAGLSLSNVTRTRKCLQYSTERMPTMEVFLIHYGSTLQLLKIKNLGKKCILGIVKAAEDADITID